MGTLSKKVSLEFIGKADVSSHAYLRPIEGISKTIVDLESRLMNQLAEFDNKNIKLNITIEVEILKN